MTMTQAAATLFAAAIIIVTSLWGVMRPPPLNHPLSQGMTEEERRHEHRVFYKFVQPAMVVVSSLVAAFLGCALIIYLV